MFSESPAQKLSAADRVVSIAEILSAYDPMLLADTADHMLGIAEHLSDLGDQAGAERIFNALAQMVPESAESEPAYVAPQRLAAGYRY
jgi:hypothetical protein